MRDLSRNFIQYWSFVKTDFNEQKVARVIGVSSIKIKEEKIKRAKTHSPEVMEKQKMDKKFKFKSEMGPKRANTDLFKGLKKEDFSNSSRPEKFNKSQSPQRKDDLAIIEEDRSVVNSRRESKNIVPTVILDIPKSKSEKVPRTHPIFRSMQHTAKAELEQLIFKVKKEVAEEAEILIQEEYVKFIQKRFG